MSQYVIQQRKGHRPYRTRWAFPINRPSQAFRYYAGLNAFDGWIKRLAILHDDGRVETLRRDCW